ncbi:hypothetical protein [Smaragdicoccus niigatensis]|uniref:hypothetical protein n=1 Tax=Smaragdicoccus niigatensis TaxID=359359 RepID=UPI000381AA22|nr:hypothetical protein [Smaragdicoccus niigatensis]
MDTNTTVDFVATNVVSGAKVDGSGIIGNGDGTYTVHSWVDNGGPQMNATYASPARDPRVHGSPDQPGQGYR